MAAALVVGAGATGWPTAARADAPPLSKAHAQFDKSSKCSVCHVVWEGVEDNKCLTCHREIKSRVAKRKGFHATVRKKCQGCHREHRGRDSSIIKVPKRFNHKLTGWPLQGRHARTKCKECHAAKRPKSKIGTRTYLFDERPICSDCHQDVHGFVKSGLGKRCDRCHNVFGFNVLNAKPDFSHSKLTDFPLKGSHTTTPCRKCHKDRRKFAPVKHRSCKSCHKDPHKGVFNDFACKDCHTEKAFRRVVFNHSVTGYGLSGTHEKTDCVNCHKKEQWQNLPKRCVDCHGDEDPHKGQFKGKACGKCHGPTRWNDETFNHNRQSTFKLEGKHARAACVKCHPTFGTSLRFKPVDGACKKCHGKEDPHEGQFGDRPCSNCHHPTAWGNIRFDHSVTKFDLEGKHALTLCDKCHPGGDTDTPQPMECKACHVDLHRNQFKQRKCNDCHSFGAFAIDEFDHAKARFPRTGRHTEIECRDCHQGGRFRPIDHRCVDCHKDFHGGQFTDKRTKRGPDCNTCHTTKWWSDTSDAFDHERDTSFPRLGRHVPLSCAKCHANNRYRPMDTKCGGCHIDVHQGDKGPDCEDCHTEGDWQVNTAIAHDFGAWRLEGVHDTLACSRCHQDERRKLGGLGIECVGCHRDPHFSAFGPICVDCHGQREWLPAKFRHYETGYRLTGRHRFVGCRDCHKNQVYGPLPTTCEFCHLEDAVRVANICGNHVFFQSCEDCHTTRGFAPGRQNIGLVCR